MKKCRDLAGHFVMSSQASEILRIKQGAKSVNVIQDVSTRWWSTYSMLERMLHLKPYIILMVRENLLLPTINLTNEQWMIVEDVCAILAPFKYVQKIMEGEKYVTVSLIPGKVQTATISFDYDTSVLNNILLFQGMINQIRVALVRADSDVNTSVAARLVLNRIITKFNEEFGTGIAGTVFTDHENGGPSRRLRGFQLKTMIATPLDPRTKTLVGNTLERNYQIIPKHHL